MGQNGADILFDTLIDWGVDTVFGLPGDGINGLMEGLRKREDKIRFVQVRHEESAAFAAVGYAKFTGRLGVCLATSGPGGLHLLNGLYDAKLDGQPVLAITGHHFSDLIDTWSQQDVDLDRVFQDVSIYSTRVMSPAHIENVVNIACRSAISGRGVAHVQVPVDFQEEEVARRTKRNVADHTSSQRAWAFPQPAESQIREAAEVLNAGSKVAILAGRGALGATDELEQVAEALGAPIVKALLGKAAVPDDSPYTTGGIGLLGTKPSQDAFEQCDTLFIVGSSFPYMEFLPEPGQARCVQIDADPQRIGLRYPVEVGLVGDSTQVLQQLLPMLRRKDDRSFLEQAQSGMSDWWQTMEERGTRDEMPMKPQVVAWELNKLLHDDAIVVSDSGSITTWWARQIKARRGQMFSCSGTLATMANGLPYALGAAVAHPGRQVVAFVGDGAFSMLMADFVTAVKHDLPIKVIVIKNNALGQIKWEQMVMNGNPEYGIQLAPIDFAKFAEACGGTGFTIEQPGECAATLAQALNTPGPVVVQAVVDPLEPPLPAKIERSQAINFAKSLARGEPNRVKIAVTAMGDKVRELISAMAGSHLVATRAAPAHDAERVVDGDTPIERVDVAAYTIPTETPESDGTLDWDSTTMVLVEVAAGGRVGIGYSYAHASAAEIVADKLAPAVRGSDAFAIPDCARAMARAVRNAGRPGVAACAIAAVDVALWDLKAKLLDLPLARLLGRCRAAVPVYGSGGFTSYDVDQLQAHMARWVEQGIPRVKMKVGRNPAADPARVAAARDAIGDDVELFVDANGAYGRRQALVAADAFAQLDVRWFEEPVSSDDLDGLRFVRDHAPAAMEVAAGEYAYDPWYVQRMLQAQAVDVLQVDATRCLGISGFLAGGALCDAWHVPYSGHCAPSVHAHAACALPALRHLEYFFDHVRIEHLLFDGALEPRDGALVPDLTRPGLGLELKRADAARYRV